MQFHNIFENVLSSCPLIPFKKEHKTEEIKFCWQISLHNLLYAFCVFLLSRHFKRWLLICKWVLKQNSQVVSLTLDRLAHNSCIFLGDLNSSSHFCFFSLTKTKVKRTYPAVLGQRGNLYLPGMFCQELGYRNAVKPTIHCLFGP